MKLKKSYTAILRNIKTSINKIDKYVPGEAEDKLKKSIKLSSNESPFLISKKIKEKIYSKLSDSNIYPDGDCKILKNAISIRYNIDKNQLICGNGSDDILAMIGLAFAKENFEIICHKFGFLYYPIIGYAVGAKVKFTNSNSLDIDPEDILKKITKKTRIIFIANPNNPTGSIIRKNDLVNMLKRIRKDIIVVLDGAYAEYVEEKDYSDGLKLVKKFPNVIVTRTFSKIYAMAGFRIGWAYSSRVIIETLEKIRGPFNVNLLAQVAGSLIINDTMFLKKSIEHNKKWKTWLVKEINSIGLKAIPGFANFVLIKTTENYSASKIVNILKSKGIFVRGLSSYGLKNYFRISIGKKEDLITLVNHLKIIAKKKK